MFEDSKAVIIALKLKNDEQWPKEKGQKDKTLYRKLEIEQQSPTKTERVSSSCSTSDTCRVTVRRHECHMKAGNHFVTVKV